MGEARRKQTGPPKIRQVIVDFPAPLWERVERVRQGVRLSRKGEVPDADPPSSNDFIVILVGRMIDLMIEVALKEEERLKAQKLAQPKLVLTPDDARLAELREAAMSFGDDALGSGNAPAQSVEALAKEFMDKGRHESRRSSI
jgi:hypothetical protein